MVVKRASSAGRRVAPSYIPQPKPSYSYVTQEEIEAVPKSQAELDYEADVAAFRLALKVAYSDKPAAIFSLSPEFGGSERAQQYYREILETPDIAKRQAAKFEAKQQEIRLKKEAIIKEQKAQQIKAETRQSIVKEQGITPAPRRSTFRKIVDYVKGERVSIKTEAPRTIAPIRIIDVGGPTTTTTEQTAAGTVTTTITTGGSIRVEGPGAFDVPVEKVLATAEKGGGKIETPAAPEKPSAFAQSVKDFVVSQRPSKLGILGFTLSSKEERGAAIRTQKSYFTSVGKLAIGSAEFVGTVFKTGFSSQYTKEELKTAGFGLNIKKADLGNISPTIKGIKEKPFSATDIQVYGAAIGLSLGFGGAAFYSTAKEIGIGPAIGQTIQTTLTPFGPKPGTYFYQPTTPKTYVATSGSQFVRAGTGTERAFTGLDDAGQIVKTSIYQRGVFNVGGTAQSVRLETIKNAPYFDIRGGFVTQGTASVLRYQTANLFASGTVYQGVAGYGLKNPLAVATGDKPAQVGLSTVNQKQLLFLQSGDTIKILPSQKTFTSGVVVDRLYNNPSAFFTGIAKKGTLSLTGAGQEFRIGEPYRFTDKVGFTPEKSPLRFGSRIGFGVGGSGATTETISVTQPQITARGTIAQSLLGVGQITAPSTSVLGPLPIPPITRQASTQKQALSQVGISRISEASLTSTTLVPAQAQIPGVTTTQTVSVTPVTTQTTIIYPEIPTITQQPFIGLGPRGYESIIGAPVAGAGLGFIEEPGRKRKGKRKYKRQPSFASYVLGITAPRPSIGEFTGLAERPILKPTRKRRKK